MNNFGTADWPGPQPNDPKPIIYLGGTDFDLDLLEIYPFWCVSYYYVNHDVDMRLLEKAREGTCRIFVDSGAFTFQMSKHRGDVTAARETYFKSYVEWVKQQPKGFSDFYVNFDYKVHCPTIYKMLQRMYRLGVKPIPVYHGDKDLDWLKKYADEGHRLVGIGIPKQRLHAGAKRHFYDQVFNFGAKHNLYFHGFACTGSLMFAYPWYSVDSTSWLRVAFLGALMDVHPLSTKRNPRLITIPVSERSIDKRLTSHLNLKERVESRGFSLPQLQNPDSSTGGRCSRARYNILTFAELSERYNHTPRVNWKSLL